MAFIALLALLLIGPKQLPEVARTLGRFINDLKRSTNGLKDEFQNQIRFDQEEIRRKIMESPQKTQKTQNVVNSAPPLPPAENIFTGDPNLPHTPMDSNLSHPSVAVEHQPTEEEIAQNKGSSDQPAETTSEVSQASPQPTTGPKGSVK